MRINQFKNLIISQRVFVFGLLGLLLFLSIFAMFNNNQNNKNDRRVAGAVEKNDLLNNSSQSQDLLINQINFKQYSLPGYVKTSAVKEVLPYFTVGNYWLYQLDFKEVDVINPTTSRQTKNIKTEVLEVINKGQIKAGLISNFPFSDLLGDDNSLTSVVLKDNRYYFINGREVFDQLKNNLADKLDFSLYDYFPKNLADMRIGSKWLAEDDSRVDNYYSYYIEDIINADLYKKIIVNYFTLPDETITEIVPGVGITQDHYIHHGSVNEKYLKLVNYFVKN